METLNVWKILALITMVICVGCVGPKPHSGAGTGAGGTEANISGTGDASSGAGTGTGGEAESSGTGDASSGAGTGTGGTSKQLCSLNTLKKQKSPEQGLFLNQV